MDKEVCFDGGFVSWAYCCVVKVVVKFVCSEMIGVFSCFESEDVACVVTGSCNVHDVFAVFVCFEELCKCSEVNACDVVGANIDLCI